MASEKKHVLTVTIPLRRGDIDAAAHLNNTNYFRFMEEARIAWYQTLGVEGPAGLDGTPDAIPSALPPGCGPIVITAACTFLKGIKFPGDVLVDVSIGEPGRSSIMIWYVFRTSYAPQTVFAEASSKALWIDIAAEKSIPLPAPVRALFEGN